MKLEGKCGCGAVKFKVDGDIMGQFVCHCRSCQHAHAAPMVMGAMVASDALSVSGDLKEIRITDLPTATKRMTCAKCGTRIFNEPAPNRRTFFPSLCEAQDWFAPQMHLFWSEHRAEVSDGCPKFLDFPEAFGGTGKMAP